MLLYQTPLENMMQRLWLHNLTRSKPNQFFVLPLLLSLVSNCSYDLYTTTQTIHIHAIPQASSVSEIDEY